ncbi:MAG: hypothetical protein LBU89_04830 [Fibromonadaceae bacterium]|jgi:hypothetical protein|nr:hypothetical protein [Fibromonadaceae bacterium]
MTDMDIKLIKLFFLSILWLSYALLIAWISNINIGESDRFCLTFTAIALAKTSIRNLK